MMRILLGLCVVVVVVLVLHRLADRAGRRSRDHEAAGRRLPAYLWFLILIGVGGLADLIFEATRDEVFAWLLDR